MEGKGGGEGDANGMGSMSGDNEKGMTSQGPWTGMEGTGDGDGGRGVAASAGGGIQRGTGLNKAFTRVEY